MDATIARARRLFAIRQRATSGSWTGCPANTIHSACLPSWSTVPCVVAASGLPWLHVSRVYRGRAAFAILKRSSPPDRPYRDYRTPELLRAVGWQPLAQRYDAASLRLLLAVVSPLGAPHPLAGYIRRTRTNDLAPILGRTVRHQNSFVPRVVSLWRSLPSALRSQPATDADAVKSLCRQAVRHLRTVH
ncbi:hypothetical protein HPB48_002295 [Haemaphysalis longicornis]|uniref:Uncharacterized protein n=1 Tax=Haemaphysalis longicornis TaxID=44386 RepID=A0A9J6FH20_HAELO|nr:hypothetical protein HPB48_002295 [Haemaphysalis longicornis]